MTSDTTIRAKAKALVIETTFSEAVATPTEKRGFVSSKLLGLVRLRRSCMVLGGMGLPVRMAARLRTCVSTSRPPAAIETANGGFLVTPEGAKTVTATTTSCASPRAHIPTTEERNAYALLQATSDATLAKMYLQQGNVPAARRKAVQLLKALQSLSNQPQGHAQQAQEAIKTVASKGGSHE